MSPPNLAEVLIPPNLAEVLRLHVLWRSGAPGGPKAGRDGVIVYHRVEEGRKYFAGLDTSGGTGGDFATMVVLRDDLEVVAVLRTPFGVRGSWG